MNAAEREISMLSGLMKMAGTILVTTVLITTGPAAADDETKAKLLEKARKGNAWAQSELGRKYANGEKGFLKNYAKARYWFSKAAKQGDASAQDYLCTLYVNGQGVRADKVLAHMWCNVAAANLKADEELAKEAAKWRDWLESGKRDEDLEAKVNKFAWIWAMNREEINRAQTLAEKCIASGYKDCGYGTGPTRPTTKLRSRLKRPKDDETKAKLLEKARKGNAWAQSELGRKEADIRKVQQVLAKCGFDPGPVDGLWGRKTEAAATAYVKRYGARPGRSRATLAAQVSAYGQSCPTAEMARISTTGKNEVHKCYKIGSTKNPVTLVRHMKDGQDTGTGTIKVAGVTQVTRFKIDGIHRKWEWGVGHTFTIEGGDGTYESKGTSWYKC